MSQIAASPLTQQELEHLAEVREVFQTVNTGGWHRIKSQIAAFVNEAFEEMVGNLSSDPMSYMRLQLRWQQRLAMQRGIEKYINDCEFERKLLIEEVTPSVPREEMNAEQDREIA